MDSHVIRIAQRGVPAGGEPAATTGDLIAGRNVQWAEIDGTRFDNIARIDIRFEDDVTMPEVTFIGRVEIVYLDAEGNEIPS